jgi:hypothetical protein
MRSHIGTGRDITAWIARCLSAGGEAEGCKSKLRAAAHDAGPVGFNDIYGHGVGEGAAQISEWLPL